MNARVTDWSLALAVAIAFASGLASLAAGRAEQWWVFALHGVAGLWLLPLTVYKLARVWPRLLRPAAWDGRTIIGAVALLLTGLVLATGILWTTGGTLVVAGYNLLNWHIIFGLLLTAAVSAHMLARARPLARRHLHGRRQALRWSAMALAVLALWPAKNAAAQVLAMPGGRRRFTGSREYGSYGGNGAFPFVSWAADRPLPIDATPWRLDIRGAVKTPFRLRYTELTGDFVRAELDAVLDCTGGFYTHQRWGGVAVAALLARAEPMPGARFVRFVSITGYRWPLPLEEARGALVATHLGGEPLAHGHGFPARLVAPGRRGFEWVKWLAAVEVLEEADPGQLLAIWVSGLSDVGSGVASTRHATKRRG
jgi:DMSO/TMAO reductase YedYZ molybdopterin-dependent catalytic subunit